MKCNRIIPGSWESLFYLAETDHNYVKHVWNCIKHDVSYCPFCKEETSTGYHESATTGRPSCNHCLKPVEDKDGHNYCDCLPKVYI